MKFLKTSLLSKNAYKAEKWLSKLHDLDTPYQEADTESWLSQFDVLPTPHDSSCLGTIGGGIHTYIYIYVYIFEEKK